MIKYIVMILIIIGFAAFGTYFIVATAASMSLCAIIDIMRGLYKLHVRRSQRGFMLLKENKKNG